MEAAIVEMNGQACVMPSNDDNSLASLNEVQLTPEQFEQEAIAISQKLYTLETKYTGSQTEREFVDSMTAQLGPQFSIELLEQVVQFYKDQVEDIKKNRLVALLKTINARKWVAASNGMEVEIEKKYSVSLTDCDKTLLAGWLEARGLGYLLTDNLAFEKGQLSPELVAELRDRGLQFARNSEVNTASLKTVIVEREKSGGELPPTEACKTSIYELAKVKYPKDKKR